MFWKKKPKKLARFSDEYMRLAKLFQDNQALWEEHSQFLHALQKRADVVDDCLNAIEVKLERISEGIKSARDSIQRATCGLGDAAQDLLAGVDETEISSRAESELKKARPTTSVKTGSQSSSTFDTCSVSGFLNKDQAWKMANDWIRPDPMRVTRPGPSKGKP